MKRLIFLTTFDYPSRYAHAIHGLHMARAFHKALGDRFLFFINTVADSTLVHIPHQLLFGRFGRRIKLLGLRRLFIRFPLWRFFSLHPEWKGKSTVLFTNDPGLIALAAVLKKRYGLTFIFEAHGTLLSKEEHMLAYAADRVIFTTSFLKEETLGKNPTFPPTAVIGNAVDVEALEAVSEDRQVLRQELALPKDALLLGYVGRFEPLGYDKGIGFLLAVLPSLQPETKLVLVGGSPGEVARYRSVISQLGLEARVTIVSHVRPELVPRYLKACDILVYTPPSGSIFFEKETSPMKVYEYMAAKRPIIISDLPTTRAILGPHDAYFIAPGDQDAFRNAVELIRNNPHAAQDAVASAFAKVASNTWDARVARIIG